MLVWWPVEMSNHWVDMTVIDRLLSCRSLGWYGDDRPMVVMPIIGLIWPWSADVIGHSLPPSKSSLCRHHRNTFVDSFDELKDEQLFCNIEARFNNCIPFALIVMYGNIYYIESWYLLLTLVILVAVFCRVQALNFRQRLILPWYRQDWMF